MYFNCTCSLLCLRQGNGAEYCNKQVCTSVCLHVREHISWNTRPNFPIKLYARVAYGLAMTGFLVAALQYVMYIRFCGWRHVFIAPMAACCYISVTAASCPSNAPAATTARALRLYAIDQFFLQGTLGRSLRLLLSTFLHWTGLLNFNLLAFIYRTVGVVNCLERRSVTCDNAQLPMLSEPCSCWPVAASMGSGH